MYVTDYVSTDVTVPLVIYLSKISFKKAQLFKASIQPGQILPKIILISDQAQIETHS